MNFIIVKTKAVFSVIIKEDFDNAMNTDRFLSLRASNPFLRWEIKKVRPPVFFDASVWGLQYPVVKKIHRDPGPNRDNPGCKNANPSRKIEFS